MHLFHCRQRTRHSERRLSGGNAQKVILAREFAKATRLLLCNQPTRGLDVGIAEFVRGNSCTSATRAAPSLASEELETSSRFATALE